MSRPEGIIIGRNVRDIRGPAGGGCGVWIWDGDERREMLPTDHHHTYPASVIPLALGSGNLFKTMRGGGWCGVSVPGESRQVAAADLSHRFAAAVPYYICFARGSSYLPLRPRTILYHRPYMIVRGTIMASGLD